MSSFNWITFFEQYRIPYVQEGANVARGNVNIRCPLCVDDPSEHMGVNLHGRGWGCWRNKTHSGRSPARLISLLLNCSHEQAQLIVGSDHHIPVDFLAQVRKHFEEHTLDTKRKSLVMPDNFKAFTGLPSSRPYEKYLKRRGYSTRMVHRMTSDYDLRYCTSGSFKGRVIFPIYHKKKLVSWTGRTIYQNKLPRYKVLSPDPEKAAENGYEPAVAADTEYLLWYDKLIRNKNGDHTLVLTEGPFDALRVRVLGRNAGITATCFFTAQPSLRQIELLHKVVPAYKHCYLLLDAGATIAMLQSLPQLSSLGVVARNLPQTIKDPGELSNLEMLKHILLDA